MIEQISSFFNPEMIYLWLNFATIPFWAILIFFPKSKFCGFFVTSIIPIIIFSCIYVYLIYYFFNLGNDFMQNFNLYLGIENLIDLFANQSFVLIFWVHFLSINLFCGGWIVRDSQKFLIPRFLIFLPLVFTYFIGPIGIMIYWITRIFFAKKINLYD